MTELSKKVSEKFEQLKAEQSYWEGLYREISDYILPYRGIFEGSAKTPQRERSKIIDSTATRALKNFAAGFQGGLNSPARPWFRLHTADSVLMKSDSVKKYLEKAEKVMQRAFARSSFYQASHTLYLEIGAFGTGCIYMEADEDKMLHFRNITAGRYLIDDDGKGNINTVIRSFSMPVFKAREMFGEEGLSEASRRLLKSAPQTQIEILHYTAPSASLAEAVTNMPYESIYVEKGAEAEPLKTGGYSVFPYLCPRYDTVGTDVYGTSAAMDVLPDVKMLQEMNKSQIQAVHKVLNPPMQAPEDMKETLSLIPASINYVDSAQKDSVRPLFQINPDIGAVSAKIEDVRTQIRSGLFNNLFLMLTDSHTMTATEAVHRHEEKLIMLGSVIERMIHEFLNPLVERTFFILSKEGFMPDAPPELEGGELKVEFVSLLAQAQKLIATRGIDSLTGFAGRIAQVAPQALDMLDADKAVAEYAEAVGVPAGLVKSADEVERIRQSRYEAQEETRKKEAVKEAVSGAKTLSEIKVEELKKLARLTGGSI